MKKGALKKREKYSPIVIVIIISVLVFLFVYLIIPERNVRYQPVSDSNIFAVGIPSITPTISGEIHVFQSTPSHQNLWNNNENDAEDASLGNSITLIPDIDGDNVPDVIAGAKESPYVAETTMEHEDVKKGMVYVYSGNDGSLIHGIEGEHYKSYFGFGTSWVKDVDSDGVDDIAVATQGVYSPRVPGILVGAAYVYSGQTGELIWKRYGDLLYLEDSNGIPSGIGVGSFGMDIEGLGSINKDSRGEIAVSSEKKIDVFDVRFIRPVWSKPANSPDIGNDNSVLGEVLLATDDLNGDNVPDLVASLRSSNIGGEIIAFRGQDGSVIWKEPVEGGNGIKFTTDLARIRDITGDGVHDILGLYYDFDTDQTLLNAISGSTGTNIWTKIFPIDTYFMLGNEVISSVKDIDMDGKQDAIVLTRTPGGGATVNFISGDDGSDIDSLHIPCPPQSACTYASVSGYAGYFE